jgi:hypothetical protein
VVSAIAARSTEPSPRAAPARPAATRRSILRRMFGTPVVIVPSIEAGKGRALGCQFYDRQTPTKVHAPTAGRSGTTADRRTIWR